MDNLASALVTWQNGVMDCQPPVVQLYYETGPDSVEWTIDSQPEDAAWVEMDFGESSPFRNVGTTIGSAKPTVVGSGNTQVKGYYKYTIRFFAADGAELGSLDPGIDNGDEPPP